jgi:large subunit ribosomal protein L21
MYAIIKTGGKQYRVQKGDVVNVEKIAGQKEGQKKVVFDQELMLREGKKTQVGAPTVKGATVEAEIIENGKSEKVVVFKYKAKKDYRNKQGHRQPYTQVKITAIKAAADKEEKEEAPVKEAAAEKTVKAVKKETAPREQAPVEKTPKAKPAKKDA